MPPRTPDVKLGEVGEGSAAAAIMAIVDRGARQRPELTREMMAEVELNIEERYPAVRIVLTGSHVLVEDGSASAPDLPVGGSLPDLVSLMASPLVGVCPIRSTAEAGPRSARWSWAGSGSRAGWRCCVGSSP
jgi:hypothetical protein